MRPKARGLAQQGGLPGWLERSDSAGWDFDFVRDGRSMPPVAEFIDSVRRCFKVGLKDGMTHNPL